MTLNPSKSKFYFHNLLPQYVRFKVVGTGFYYSLN